MVRVCVWGRTGAQLQDHFRPLARLGQLHVGTTTHGSGHGLILREN